MRFLFTMSEIERSAPSGARLPSTLSKRQAPQKRNLFKLHRKDSGAPAPSLVQPRVLLNPEASSTGVETSKAKTFGGARRDRTDDLMLAKHALSQLSYGPVSRLAGAQSRGGPGRT